jgi:hypothetical protein
MQVSFHLVFGGQCEAAFQFYERTFEARPYFRLGNPPHRSAASACRLIEGTKRKSPLYASINEAPSGFTGSGSDLLPSLELTLWSCNRDAGSRNSLHLPLIFTT